MPPSSIANVSSTRDAARSGRNTGELEPPDAVVIARSSAVAEHGVDLDRGLVVRGGRERLSMADGRRVPR
jgi:hypothetical protein